MKTEKADLPRHHRMFRLIFFSNSFNGAKMESIERKTKLLARYFFGSEYSFGTYEEKLEMLMRTKERIISELFFPDKKQIMITFIISTKIDLRSSSKQMECVVFYKFQDGYIFFVHFWLPYT